MRKQKPGGYSGAKGLLAVAALSGAAVCVVYALCSITPFGPSSLLTGDLNGIYVPYYHNLKNALLGNTGFAYSFNKSLGDGMAGDLAYYYASPFNLLYLLFPLRLYPLAASLVFWLKTVLTSCSFYVFLHRKHPALRWIAVALALGYGLTAYSVAYSQNIMWHDVALLLPLLCLGADGILAGRSPVPYTLFLALAICCNFYIAYMACIFLVLYVAYSVAAAENAPAAAKRLPAFLLASLLGAGLSCAVLLPGAAGAVTAKGGLGGFAFSLKSMFAPGLLLEQGVWGAFQWSNLETGRPLLYCGVLAAALGPAFFFSRGIPARQKLAAGGVLAVLLASFLLEGPDKVWHAFKAPVWFPYRYSFVFCFFVLLLGGEAAARPAFGKRDILLSGGAALLLYGVVLAFPRSVSRSKALLSIGLLAAFCVLLLLAATAKSGRRRALAGCLLALLAAADMGGNAAYILSRFDDNQPAARFVEFAAGTAESMQRIRQNHLPDTLGKGELSFRREKNYFYTLNDSMLAGFEGMSHFSSTNNSNSPLVLHNLGWRGYSYYAYGSTAFAESVLGLGYILDGGEKPLPAHLAPDACCGEDGPPVYRNPYVLPLAFSVPLTPPAAAAKEQDSFAYQNRLYGALSGAAAPLFTPGGTVELEQADGRAPLPLPGEIPQDGRLRFTAAEDGLYYALPVAKGGALHHVGMEIGGRYAGTYFSSDHNGIINLGYLRAGETQTLRWEQEGAIALDALYFCRMDETRLARLAQQAGQDTGSLVLQSGRLHGSVPAKGEGRMLFTAIPYSPNWKAELNGRPATAENLQGFLVLRLQAGENRVDLRYKTPFAAAGLACSALSGAAVAAWALLPGLASRRNRRRKTG